MAIDTLPNIFTELLDTVAYEGDATGALAYRRIQAIRQLLTFTPEEVLNGDQRIQHPVDYWEREQAKIEAWRASTLAVSAGGPGVVRPNFTNWGGS